MGHLVENLKKENSFLCEVNNYCRLENELLPKLPTIEKYSFVPEIPLGWHSLHMLISVKLYDVPLMNGTKMVRWQWESKPARNLSLFRAMHERLVSISIKTCYFQGFMLSCKHFLRLTIWGFQCEYMAWFYWLWLKEVWCKMKKKWLNLAELVLFSCIVLQDVNS